MRNDFGRAILVAVMVCVPIAAFSQETTEYPATNMPMGKMNLSGPMDAVSGTVNGTPAAGSGVAQGYATTSKHSGTKHPHSSRHRHTRRHPKRQRR